MLQLPATPATLLSEVIYPALVVLPSNMDTSAAHAMLLAAALHQSGLHWRRAHNDTREAWPERSFWGLTEADIRAALTDPNTDDLAAMACREAKLAPVTRTVHRALEQGAYDRLACQLARLRLWSDPKPLPRARYDAEGEAFLCFTRTFQPRERRASNWREYWRAAVEAVS